VPLTAADAAYEVLREAGVPLHVRDLTERMVASGRWVTQGLTPHDTVSAILGTEIVRRGTGSRFIRRGPNVFDLRRADDAAPPVDALGDGPTVWLFQANPKRYDVPEAAAREASDQWSMNQHREHVAVGDTVWFFHSGSRAGVYAVGRVTSPVYRAEVADEFGAWKVDIQYEATIDPPLLRDPEIIGDAALAAFAPFLGRLATNFPMPPAVAERLDTVTRSRRRPVVGATPEDRATLELDRAMEAARREAQQQLLDHLCAMDPGRFEHVLRLLLEKLEYAGVEVTGRSGDRGIDLRATLRYRGVADVPTHVQAKRFSPGNNVDGATVGRLRGSLPVEAHGIVITTSGFTRQARDEARAPGLKPIILIDGTELVQLLTDLEIGIKRRSVEIYRFAPDDIERRLEG